MNFQKKKKRPESTFLKPVLFFSLIHQKSNAFFLSQNFLCKKFDVFLQFLQLEVEFSHIFLHLVLCHGTSNYKELKRDRMCLKLFSWKHFRKAYVVHRRLRDHLFCGSVIQKCVCILIKNLWQFQMLCLQWMLNFGLLVKGRTWQLWRDGFSGAELRTDFSRQRSEDLRILHSGEMISFICVSSQRNHAKNTTSTQGFLPWYRKRIQWWMHLQFWKLEWAHSRRSILDVSRTRNGLPNERTVLCFTATFSAFLFQAESWTTTRVSFRKCIPSANCSLWLLDTVYAVRAIERVPAGSCHFSCLTDPSQSVVNFPCVRKWEHINTMCAVIAWDS